MEQLNSYIKSGYQLTTPAVTGESTGGQQLWRSVKAISGVALMSKKFPPVNFIVDGLIAEGAGILAGPRKEGKSWWALDLCMSVANGEPFLGRQTKQGATLYCAFEDPPRRLQSRMQILGKTVSPDFYLLSSADLLTIDTGLMSFLEFWAHEHIDARLVVVDVLGCVWRPDRRSDPYVQAYEMIGEFKRFAETYNVAVILITHTRKRGPGDGDDPFDRVLGSTGITSAADFTIVLDRRSNSKLGTLSITGRDVASDTFSVEFDHCRWSVADSNAGDGNDQIRKLIRGLAANPGGWCGTPAQGVAMASAYDAFVTSPESMGRYMQQGGDIPGITIQRRTKTSRDYIVRRVPIEGNATDDGVLDWNSTISRD